MNGDKRKQIKDYQLARIRPDLYERVKVLAVHHDRLLTKELNKLLEEALIPAEALMRMEIERGL